MAPDKNVGSNPEDWLADDEVVTLLVVDDHPLIVNGLETQLRDHDHLSIVGTAASGEEAIEKATALKPNIVIMDIGLPGMHGIEAAKRIRETLPGTEVIILTTYNDDEYIVEAAKSGAKAYILKSTGPAVLIEAIESVRRGRMYFPPEVSAAFVTRYVDEAESSKKKPELSKRELQVLGRIAEGCINKEIADELSLSVRTVETYRERIMRKLDKHTAADLTRWAIAHGVVTLNEQ